jgi:NAD(P)-dependent dehydrogenase (short-subunit alcohol dehydrogenase family)
LFAAEGAKVVIADLGDGTEAVETIRAAGGAASFIDLDVGDDSSVQHAVEHTVSTFGGLHVLYNNAGISPGDDDGPTNTSDFTWQTVLDVNVTGVARCCRHGIPAMLASGGGSIINVASFVAHLGAATPQIAYTASKGAVLSMTREIACIYARQGIRANALCPGPVLTPPRARPDGALRRADRDRQGRPFPGLRRLVVHDRSVIVDRRRDHRRLHHTRVNGSHPWRAITTSHTTNS